MGRYTNFRILELITRANQTVSAIESKESIREPLVEMGVDAAHVERGAELAAALREAYDAFEDRWSDVANANQSVAKADEAAQALVRRDVKLARAAVGRGDSAYAQLRLRRLPNFRRRSDWTDFARAFYTTLQAEASLRDAVAPYPIDPQAGLDALTALADAVAERESARAAAKRATRTRNDLARTLERYLHSLVAVAELTFTENRQMLEFFGVTVPSR